MVGILHGSEHRSLSVELVSEQFLDQYHTCCGALLYLIQETQSDLLPSSHFVQIDGVVVSHLDGKIEVRINSWKRIGNRLLLEFHHRLRCFGDYLFL